LTKPFKATAASVTCVGVGVSPCARAPSSLGEQFKSVGLKLPNAYGQDYYNASHEDVGNKISAYHQEVAAKQQQYDQQLAQYNQQKALYDQQKAAYTQQQQQLQNQQTTRQAQIDDLYSQVTSSTADWQNRYGPAKESIEKYLGYGFVPGQNNKDWIWTSGRPGDDTVLPDTSVDENTGMRTTNYGYVPAMTDAERFHAGYAEDGWGKIQQDANRDPNGYKVVQNRDGTSTAHFNSGKTVDDWGKNSAKYTGGYWLNSNGSNRGVTYNPSIGFGESDFDHAATGFNKWMPGITLGVLGGMFGGAGAALGGAAGSTGAAVGQAIGGALPSTIATGAQTGDWGKALGTGAVSALGGGLAGMYGGDLSKLMNMSPSAAQGLIKAGVGLAGNGLMGKEVNWKDALTNATSGTLAPIMGNFAGEAVGGDLGKVVGGAATKFTGSALNNILKGKDLDIGTAISTLQGAAGGLGGLFSNTKDDKQSVNGPTSLARTLQGVKNGPAATSRRT